MLRAPADSSLGEGGVSAAAIPDKGTCGLGGPSRCRKARRVRRPCSSPPLLARATPSCSLRMAQSTPVGPLRAGQCGPGPGPSQPAQLRRVPLPRPLSPSAPAMTTAPLWMLLGARGCGALLRGAGRTSRKRSPPGWGRASGGLGLPGSLAFMPGLAVMGSPRRRCAGRERAAPLLARGERGPRPCHHPACAAGAACEDAPQLWQASRARRSRGVAAAQGAVFPGRSSAAAPHLCCGSATSCGCARRGPSTQTALVLHRRTLGPRAAPLAAAAPANGLAAAIAVTPEAASASPSGVLRALAPTLQAALRAVTAGKLRALALRSQACWPA